jgi:hypothetical protein
MILKAPSDAGVRGRFCFALVTGCASRYRANLPFGRNSDALRNTKAAIGLYWLQLYRLFDRFKDSLSSACPWGGAGGYRRLSPSRSQQMGAGARNPITGNQVGEGIDVSIGGSGLTRHVVAHNHIGIDDNGTTKSSNVTSVRAADRRITSSPARCGALRSDHEAASSTASSGLGRFSICRAKKMLIS